MYDPNIAPTLKVEALLEALKDAPADADVFYADIENGPMRVFPVFQVQVYSSEADLNQVMVALIG